VSWRAGDSTLSTPSRNRPSLNVLASSPRATSPSGIWHGPCFTGGVSAAPGRLLIIDDEAAIRFALSEYFEECGWDVDAAAEKEEAEALLAHTEYAVVIADLRLTGIYGVEGLDIIQWSRHLRPETRVVLLTGNGTPEIEAEARRRGADAFLHKPLPLPELARVVTRLVGRTA
jgi:DNA-binding response OmpR family regulator